jgi:hypothetical protein
MAAYLVTRMPGAPPRRAGREWAMGETRAELDAAQVAALDDDPRYGVVPIGPAEPQPAQDPPPKRRGRPRKTEEAAP